MIRHRRTGKEIADPVLLSTHEACHVVIAEASGLRVGRARIDPGEEMDGSMIYTSAMDWTTDWTAAYVALEELPPSQRGGGGLRPPRLTREERAQLDRDVTVSCAGYAGEIRLLGGRPSHQWSTCSVPSTGRAT